MKNEAQILERLKELKAEYLKYENEQMWKGIKERIEQEFIALAWALGREEKELFNSL